MEQKVYVIDDDPALRDAYTAALSELGYLVQVAEDGEKGMQLIKDDIPTAIIVDLNMPNLNGVGFLRELRQLPDADKVVVVVASSVDPSSQVIKDTAELGVSRYLGKTEYVPGQVAAVLDQHIKDSDQQLRQ